MSPQRFAILTYHAIDTHASVISTPPELFRWQMAELARSGWRAITLKQSIDHLQHQGTFPPKAVALTFDDGFRSVYEHALPVMQEFNFTATFFVVADLVGSTSRGTAAIDPHGDREFMDTEELKELLDHGMEVGSHTNTHPRLTRLALPQVEDELIRSKQCLESQLNVGIEALAYPYGDYDSAIRNLAARYYAVACTTNLGRNHSQQDLFQLHRVDSYYLRSLDNVRKLCDGQLDDYLAIRQVMRRIKRWLVPQSKT